MAKNRKKSPPTFFFGYHFPIGQIFIAEDEFGICDISFENEFEGIVTEKETPLIKKAAKQLQEYFSAKRKTFSIKLSTHGTPFQESVWQQLQKIPYGTTTYYGSIAEAIGNPKASRAVGMANNKNRISIMIPCHRVIGKNNTLVGYAGGLDIKKYLLDIENN
ncbi:MAG: methylated-DNA--[protein]-cysteine S-methyltransferase [Peptostreptococcaceae bacterium]|nr:methylated-DNA--[protein]-cysteine S-methyltransferase [Peptostreptococcaceae bacterium]